MRTILLTFICCVIILFGLNAQSITGDWSGILEVQGTTLPLNFHISKTDEGYISTIDSPKQNAMGLPTTSATFKNNELIITAESMQMVYKGILKGDLISGTFTQRTNKYPLNFKRVTLTELNKKIARPQDPKKPYPYTSEDITFVNTKANNIKLSGTLTLPRDVKNPPVAVLISGTGAQNRDEEIFNHRPFLILSDYLTRHGIAVLRYDDRGYAESEGTREGANSEDFATDVEAAISYLRSRPDINTQKIGLIGHSEGGFIAPIVASKDKNISFIVSLAGPGLDGISLSLSQTRRAAELENTSIAEIDFNEKLFKRMFKIIENEKDVSRIEAMVVKSLKRFRAKNASNPFIEILTDEEIVSRAKKASSPKNLYFFKTNPRQFWSKVECPVLAINGEKDSQVLSKLNLSAIQKALKLAKNEDVTIMELEGLNHLFQNADTGSSREYGLIEETFSPKALELIKEWIAERVK